MSVFLNVVYIMLSCWRLSPTCLILNADIQDFLHSNISIPLHRATNGPAIIWISIKILLL